MPFVFVLIFVFIFSLVVAGVGMKSGFSQSKEK